MRVQHFEVRLYVLYLFLAIFHIPIFYIGNDSIGVFDIYLVIMLFYMLLNPFRTYCLKTIHWRQLLLLEGAWIVFMFLQLLWDQSQPSIVLALKNLEFGSMFALCIVNMESFPDQREYIFSRTFALLLLMALFQVALFLGMFNSLGFEGSWQRVGLPFTAGVSSNPAGFILGFSLLLLILGTDKKQWVSALAVALPLGTALILTVSRTNIIAFLLSLALYFFIRMASKLRWTIIAALVAALIFAALTIAANTVPPDHILFRFLKFIEDPSTFLSDPSFALRYSRLWPEAFAAWQSSIFSLLFGNGPNYMQIVDGTIPRLLSNSGLLGLTLFFCIWFGHFLLYYGSNPKFLVLLFFVFLNSITAETLLVSYRSVQAFLPLLFLSCYQMSQPHDALLRRTQIRLGTLSIS